MCGLLHSPPVVLAYQWANVGPQRGATHHTACPVLCHSESNPLDLSVCKCMAAESASGPTACPIGPTFRQSRYRHSNSSSLSAGCLSQPLLPVRMNVYFLFPWCRTPLPFDSLSVLVVRGGAVYLPTPPSWFSPCPFFYWVVCLPGGQSCEFFIYFGDQALV